MLDYMVMKDLRKNLKRLSNLSEYLISWENIKILSLFLMGDSGVGKTEVARSIHKALGSKSKIWRKSISENYSSHDAFKQFYW